MLKHKTVNLKSSEKTGAGYGVSRRRFIRSLACGSLAIAGFPAIAKAATQQSRKLSFYHTHTGEQLSLNYYDDGRYLADALQEVNYVLRDFRTGDIHTIDTALLDQLYDLKMVLGVDKPFQIISGYRSPYTNGLLRKKSNGVASKSLHLQGRAIDIRIEGVDSRLLKNAAIAMRSGGVGYYQGSNFVHIDTGRVRSW